MVPSPLPRGAAFTYINAQVKQKNDTLVLAVAHKEFNEIDFSHILNENHVIYDVKNVLKSDQKDGGL